MKLRGIDVSHHQGTIDWDRVKSQIDYAILSVGYGDNITSQDDKQFQERLRIRVVIQMYLSRGRIDRKH